MNVFPCIVEKCGRKFNKKEELKDHYSRRHSGHVSSALINPTKNNIEQPLHSETTLNLKANKILVPEFVKTNLKKPLMIPKKKFTSSLISNQRLRGKTPELKKSDQKDTGEKSNNNNEITIEKINDNITICSMSFNKDQPEKSNENTTGYSMSFNKEPAENDQQNFEDFMKDGDSDIEIIDSPVKEEKVEFEKVLESKNKLNEKFIIQKSALFEKIEHITTVMALIQKNIFFKS